MIVALFIFPQACTVFRVRVRVRVGQKKKGKTQNYLEEGSGN